MEFISTPGMPSFMLPTTSSQSLITSTVVINQISSQNAVSISSPLHHHPPPHPQSSSRYENQKRRDWNTFCQFLRNHRPPLSPPLIGSTHVLEFLRYLDQFGKTKVHNQNCPYFGIQNPPGPCPCPLRQAWGSLDALIGRLRAAYEEHGGLPESNPFGARGVRLFLRDVRDFQSKSRGISYEKKRKRNKLIKVANAAVMESSSGTSTTLSG